MKKLVQVMGPGCAKCDEVEKRAKEVVAENSLDVDVEKVTDFQKMAVLGVFSTPALAVDGTVKVVGRVPRKDEIRAWLTEA